MRVLKILVKCVGCEIWLESVWLSIINLLQWHPLVNLYKSRFIYVFAKQTDWGRLLQFEWLIIWQTNTWTVRLTAKEIYCLIDWDKLWSDTEKLIRYFNRVASPWCVLLLCCRSLFSDIWVINCSHSSVPWWSL